MENQGTSWHALGNLGNPSMNTGAPNWFHNISTHNEKVIDYQSYFVKSHG